MLETAPLQIVILGGTGDLSTRKLLPALFDLYTKKSLPKKFSIIGTARREYDHAAYREFVKETINSHGHKHRNKKQIDNFCKNVFYTQGSFDSKDLFSDLKQQLDDCDCHFKQCSNRMFYLAVPPSSYDTIFKMLHKHKLHLPCAPKISWTRVLVEKPFGDDVKTAERLDKQLGTLFKEDQIFRIDHYLAKEAVQNILSFRFANTLTKSAWNGHDIARIEIVMHESVDVENRGSFYDDIGTLRDVGQNHLLQLLALLTMDEPACFDAAHIRANRLAILKKLKPITPATIKDTYVRAQYQGYKKTKGVSATSRTETYFQLKAELTDPDWKGVPIYISSGKALNEPKVEVVVHFNDIASGLFLTHSCQTSANEIRLTISPRQKMSITLNAKEPGLGYQLESRTLEFDCELGKSEVTNSYEKVLLDCINGDQTLFTTTDEVKAQWKYINTIIKNVSAVPLQTYKQGSRGPKHTLFDVT